MPKKVENKLSKEATKKWLKGERKDAYVYWTMNKLWLLSKSKKK